MILMRTKVSSMSNSRPLGHMQASFLKQGMQPNGREFDMLAGEPYFVFLSFPSKAQALKLGQLEYHFLIR